MQMPNDTFNSDVIANVPQQLVAADAQISKVGRNLDACMLCRKQQAVVAAFLENGAGVVSVHAILSEILAKCRKHN